MSGEVRALQVHKPDPVIVERLEELLARAKAGEVTSLAFGAVLTGRRVLTSFRAGEDGLELFALIGILAELGRQMGQASTDRAGG